jgi:MOSC domain-containing protein YiiM
VEFVIEAASGILIAISISRRRGIPKVNVEEAILVENWGIEGDAHAGDWHRQISLLSLGSIDRMVEMGARVKPGDFAENLTVDGFPITTLIPGHRLTIGETELEITQVGKECHSHCAIFQQVGDCVMPREGIFARVIRGGRISPGMKIDLIRGQAG